MAPFSPFDKDIEVLGRAIYSVIDSFRHDKVAPSKILAKAGIGVLNDAGLLELDLDHWYPQEPWLKAFEEICEYAGEEALFDTGARVPTNALFPPWSEGIHRGIRSIDIAYHLNHRKNGQAMYDGAKDEVMEGIGNYGYQPVEGENKIISVCENPYPCSFDHGILTAVATRFEPGAKVLHQPARPCRRMGDRKCTFVIVW